MEFKHLLRKIPFAVKTKNLIQKITQARPPTTSEIVSSTHQCYRKLRYGSYSFVSIQTATNWTSDWVSSFKEQYDIIIGIPRSGLLFANIISLKLGKPLATPDIFIKKKYWYTKSVDAPKKITKVLIVDDSINSGAALKKTLIELKKGMGTKAFNALDITTAALIARTSATALVDMHYKALSEPTLFEWNIMHSNGVQSKKLGTDLDGVLCPNFIGDDLDEDKYIKWLKNAPPYLIPAFPIDVIVTNRLEQYRDITEAWLKKNNIRYKKLVMWNLKDKSKRSNRYAKQKTKMVLRERVDLFYESARWEAEYIFKKTRIPTLCVDDMEMFS